MARNKITDLRDHLFEMIENIKDADKPHEIDKAIRKAKAVVEVSDILIESAKVEVSYINATGQSNSQEEFFKPINSIKQLNH